MFDSDGEIFLANNDERLRLDITIEATQPFGFVFMQPVQTPLGPGHAVGVLDGELYFQLQKTGRVSYWGGAKTLADFARMGIVGTDEAANASGERSVYHNLKSVTVGGVSRKIVMQTHNGPCPVIAVANALILRGELQQIANERSNAISADRLRAELLTHLQVPRPPPRFSEEALAGRPPLPTSVKSPTTAAEAPQSESPVTPIPSLASCCRDEQAFNQRRSELFADPQQSVERLRRLYQGLDVSPHFTAVDGFDGDPEILLFPMAGVRVLHGWIIHPDGEDAALRPYSFNELVVLATTEQESLSAVALQFTQQNTQMTIDGLSLLHQTLEDGEVAVLFWNNHFSTIMKKGDKVLCLLSDVSFVDRACIVFEEIIDPFGNVEYTDGDGVMANRTVLDVQSRTGDRFTEDQITLAQAQLVSSSETLEQPSTEQIIAHLEAESAAPPQSAGAPKNPLLLTAPPSPAVSSTVPPPVPLTPAVQSLLDMGVATTAAEATELLNKYRTVDAAIAARFGS